MARQNGRIPPAEKLEEFTFTDTGRTVQIRKVSTLLRAEVRRQVVSTPDYAEPRPPVTEVDYGDGKVRVPNPAHPVYQTLHAEWSRRVSEEVGNRLKTIAIRRGVVADVDAAAVTDVRHAALEDGLDLSMYDDHYVYVAFVCMGSEDDWVDLLRAVFERSAPQEAAIAAHIATFPGDVRGEGSMEPEP